MRLALSRHIHKTKFRRPVLGFVRMQANEVFCLRDAVDGQCRQQSLDVRYRGLLLGLELVQIERFGLSDRSCRLFDRSCHLFSLLFRNQLEFWLFRGFIRHGVLLEFDGLHQTLRQPTACACPPHLAASSKVMYRREPTAVSRGPRPCAFSLKYMLMLSLWAKQNSRTEYQAGGTGGPRIGVALPFVCESGSLLVVGSIAVASAIGGPGSRFASSAVCAGFLPVISPRAIVVNSMKAHGAKYEHWKFAGRTDAVR